MNLDKLISEEINKYITESFFEAKKEHKHKDTDVQRKYKIKNGNDVSRSDEEILRRLFATNYLNEAAIAREVYPDHTPEGAQSQLRKKLVGETNDNGSEYHLKEREAAAIRNIINKIKSAIA